MNLKTILSTTLCSLFLLIGCSPKTATSYTISGEIEGLPAEAVIQFTPISHDLETPIAEAVAVNGKFTLKGQMEEPLAVRLSVKDTYGSQMMMLENASININGKLTESKAYDGTAQYDFSGLNVTGSPLTKKYMELYSIRGKMDDIYNAHHETYAEVHAKLSALRQEKNEAALEEFTKTEEYKAMAESESNFFQTVSSSYEQLVMDNKDTFWGPLMMITLTSYLGEEQKSWYEAFSEEAKQSYYGQKVKEELYPAGQVGSEVEAFTIEDATGKKVSLDELCQGKKYILLDFWASWCNPCRKEIPNLKKLYAQYADKGFEIISISIDKKAEDWEKALEEEQLPWPNFLDKGEIAALYKIKFVPTMYLIDAEKVMVGENLRGEELANKLESLFQP
ncbi:thiol-disulfide isomerase/thioredoxin [Parabacteroides sp. PFB2-10]|uniref:TlpA disulfide reductase family protein n=1 Tax=Parabacteroides sp. PFB2-10 TaxID=1742405 RepID=UPI002474C157|nr:TlpA disulfide reductase family protein [Parabacteroides sp. PFB2-10]MDH6311309.1 thiol-disulfide isomerase/thioredoxin [Parabacteroides sp. PFB2-10]MDL2245776.1 AhpC/TSA family protein [Parabacteroides sp. OttesenSCG-928-J18]